MCADARITDVRREEGAEPLIWCFRSNEGRGSLKSPGFVSKTYSRRNRGPQGGHVGGPGARKGRTWTRSLPAWCLLRFSHTGSPWIKSETRFASPANHWTPEAEPQEKGGGYVVSTGIQLRSRPIWILPIQQHPTFIHQEPHLNLLTLKFGFVDSDDPNRPAWLRVYLVTQARYDQLHRSSNAHLI